MGATGHGQRRRWVLSMLQEHEVPLTRFAARLLGDEDAARDVVQHAFLRLCDQSPGELDGREAPWLFAVCRNKAVDTLRSRTRTEPLPENPDRIGPGSEPDPADVAEKQEVYRRINALVDRLPEAQRESVGLWSEGFTYRQIAQMTVRNEGNVRVLVHRALKTLRRHPVARQLLGTLT